MFGKPTALYRRKVRQRCQDFSTDYRLAYWYVFCFMNDSEGLKEIDVKLHIQCLQNSIFKWSLLFH